MTSKLVGVLGILLVGIIVTTAAFPDGKNSNIPTISHQSSELSYSITDEQKPSSTLENKVVDSQDETILSPSLPISLIAEHTVVKRSPFKKKHQVIIVNQYPRGYGGGYGGYGGGYGGHGYGGQGHGGYGGGYGGYGGGYGGGHGYKGKGKGHYGK